MVRRIEKAFWNEMDNVVKVVNLLRVRALIPYTEEARHRLCSEWRIKLVLRVRHSKMMSFAVSDSLYILSTLEFCHLAA